MLCFQAAACTGWSSGPGGDKDAAVREVDNQLHANSLSQLFETLFLISVKEQLSQQQQRALTVCIPAAGPATGHAQSKMD